jgi:hypothetical protein
MKIFIYLFLTATFFACKKPIYDPQFSKAEFIIDCQVEGEPLIWDSIRYATLAGDNIGVNNLQFYISSIELMNSNGKKYTSNKIIFVDPTNSSKNKIYLDSIPPGNYISMFFLIGLDSSRNKTMNLNATTDNLNMAWPDVMGGGYHFFKMEGNFLDSTGKSKGYAIHIGKNQHLPTTQFDVQMKQKYWDHKYKLIFNISEVFKNPYTYSFKVDKNYTMMDSLSIEKIKNNLTDVFSLSQIQ